MVLFSWAELENITGGRWLNGPAEDGGVRRICTDSRTIEPGDCFCALSGQRFDGHDFAAAAAAAGAAAVVIRRAASPPAAVPALGVSDPLEAYQLLARAHRLRFDDLLVVGITGSFGKTSCKEMIGSILRAHFQGAVLVTEGNANTRIGVPRTLFRLNADHRAAVVEMGSDAPGGVALLSDLVQPDVAVITSVGRAHLQGFCDLDGVAREKAAILSRLRPGGWAVVEAGAATHPSIRDRLPSDSVTFGWTDNATVRVVYLGGSSSDFRFRVLRGSADPLDVGWSLPGAHMALNAAAAVAVAHRLGIADRTVLEGLAACRLPPMRMEIRRAGGVTWINDCYNANPESVKALIDWLAETPNPDGRDFLILGDMLELGPSGPRLHREVCEHAVRSVPWAELMVFGPAMSEAAQSPAFASTDIESLRKALFSRLRPGDRVTLKASRGMALERLME